MNVYSNSTVECGVGGTVAVQSEGKAARATEVKAGSRDSCGGGR